MARRKEMSSITETAINGENTIARIQEVISQTRAEIERAERLVKQIRAARKRNRARKKDEPK